MDERAQRILDEAESKLAKLAGELVSSRRNDEAKPIMQLVDELAALRVGVDRDQVNPVPVPAPNPRVTSKPTREDGYPKFRRDGETLVKIGYSRRQRREYEHRCPLESLVLVAARVARVADRSGRLSSDDLMPVPDGDGDVLPSYQSYLCLAFLREQGLVEQSGRSRYRIVSPGDLQADAAARVRDLPPHIR